MPQDYPAISISSGQLIFDLATANSALPSGLQINTNTTNENAAIKALAEYLKVLTLGKDADNAYGVVVQQSYSTTPQYQARTNERGTDSITQQYEDISIRFYGNTTIPSNSIDPDLMA